MTNAIGTSVETSEYLPYGGQREQIGTSITDYKFTDQELYTQTGLYNYDARLYDPVIGKCISADSIIPDLYNPQSLNRYSYVLNNPLRYVDPTGHEDCDYYDGSGWINYGEDEDTDDEYSGVGNSSDQNSFLDKVSDFWKDVKDIFVSIATLSHDFTKSLMVAEDMNKVNYALNAVNNGTPRSNMMEALNNPGAWDNLQNITNSLGSHDPVGSLQDEIGNTWGNVTNQE